MRQFVFDIETRGPFGEPMIILDIDVPAPRRQFKADPMMLSMLIHFATSLGPYTPEAHRTSNRYVRFVREMLREGLIERPTKSERRRYKGFAYRATARGLAYLDALTDVQLPVLEQRWVRPE